MADVFISYAAKDSAIVEALARKLVAQDVSVFFDTGALVAGKSTSEPITKALDHAKAIVVVLSREAVRRRFVEHELARFLEGDKIVVPVLHGSGATENWVWPLVADRPAIVVNSTDDLDAVVDRVRVALGVGQRPSWQRYLPLAPLIIGLGTAAVVSGKDVIQALLWALAFWAGGALAGFFFGVPRRSTRMQPVEAVAAGASYTSNTNLEHIADWLTKMLVGVALVEARDILSGAESLVAFVAATLGSAVAPKPLATFLMIYFVTVGFVAGYALARLLTPRVEATVVGSSSLTNDRARFRSSA